MKVAIVSGGTGGHIYPGIAIAQEIKRRDPGASILFLGSDEVLEKYLIPREEYTIKLIRSRALLRKLSYKAFTAPLVSSIGFAQSIAILRKFAPDHLVSTGGFASLPVVLAARLLRIPIILHEQNVLPGMVNRVSKRLAAKVFLSFSESLCYMHGEVVGNPVRREIIEAERDSARKKFNFSGRDRAILVMGGSQGSKKINETVLSALDRLPEDARIFHIIGNRDFGWVNRYLEGKKLNNYQALPYLHDMADALAAADLVISRAGATAIAEFMARGLPMVLIPFPYAAEDHQRLNARAIADKGAAIIVEDSELTPEKFIAIINDSSLNYDKMKVSARRLARPDAAERIVDHIYG